MILPNLKQTVLGLDRDGHSTCKSFVINAVINALIFVYFVISCQIGALIVTPTRELAIQIDDVLSHFVRNLPQLTHMLMIGGNNPSADVDKFLENGYEIGIL